MQTILSPETIVLAAGVSFVLGYLIINQVILRLMVALGTCLYIWYYAVAADTPLWAAIWTSLAMGVANLIGLLSLFARNSKLAIPAEHADLYPQMSTLPPGDFRTLVRNARRYRADHEQTITTEGAAIDRLYFVISGQLKAEKFGQQFDLPAGIFVGEVAYMTGNPSSATTRLQKNSEVLEWDVATLRKMAAKNIRFKLALEALISKDLAQKVSAAIAPTKARTSKV